MDEPTAALSQRGSRAAVRDHRRAQAPQLRRSIYVSHRIDEVLRIADRITVLRDGVTEPPMPRAEATRDALIERMTGRAALGTAPAEPLATREPRRRSLGAAARRPRVSQRSRSRSARAKSSASPALADAGGDRLLQASDRRGAARRALDRRAIRFASAVAADAWRADWPMCRASAGRRVFCCRRTSRATSRCRISSRSAVSALLSEPAGRARACRGARPARSPPGDRAAAEGLRASAAATSRK